MSARIPKEDAEFLSGLQIQGAVTASDKVRALIAEARQRSRGANDFPTCLGRFETMIAPILQQVRHLELQEGTHSELVARVLEWLPETMAFVLSSQEGLDGDGKVLRQLEAGVAERAFRLMESVLQLGVTHHCPCYLPTVVRDRIGPTLELANVIESKRTHERR